MTARLLPFNLTQLARSPLVRRSDQEGVYLLDLGLVAEARERLHDLHRRLAALPPPGQLRCWTTAARAGASFRARSIASSARWRKPGAC